MELRSTFESGHTAYLHDRCLGCILEHKSDTAALSEFPLPLSVVRCWNGRALPAPAVRMRSAVTAALLAGTSSSVDWNVAPCHMAVRQHLEDWARISVPFPVNYRFKEESAAADAERRGRGTHRRQGFCCTSKRAGAPGGNVFFYRGRNHNSTSFCMELAPPRYI